MRYCSGKPRSGDIIPLCTKLTRDKYNNFTRKVEIVNWFNTNHINEDFVIIDDDKSLNELPEFLKSNLVQTSPYFGLTVEHLENIRKIQLNEGQMPAT